MKLHRLFPALIVAFLLFLIGCGGGGGGTSTGTTATTGLTATAGTTGIQTTGSTGINLMSDSSRQTIIQNITTALGALSQTNGQWNATQAAAALSKITGLQSVTAASTGDVIALFSDGVPFSLFNSPMPLTAPGRKYQPQALPSRLPTIPTGSTVAYVIDTQAPVLAVGETQTPTELGGMFAHAGYSPIVSTATVAVMRQLGNYTAAGMLFHGHGGECHLAPSLVSASGGASLGWGMQTADIANFNASDKNYNAPNYKTDLKSGALGVAMSNYDFQKNLFGQDEAGKFISTTFYFATQLFPKIYKWKFSTGSLIYLSCCEGGSPAAIQFQKVLQGLGAGAVAGWTNETQPEKMNAAQEALLSEMTGSNTIKGAIPPRRPFSFISTKTELDLQNTTNYFLPNGQNTELELTSFVTPEFQAFAPSLDYISPIGTTIGLSGIFGPTQGKVMLAGVSLAIQSWSNNYILCALPAKLTGQCFVQVPFGNITRNTNFRELSSWSGTVTDTQIEDGVQIAKATMQVNLRAAISPYYEDALSTTLVSPPTATQWNTQEGVLPLTQITALNSDSCSVSAGGTFMDSGATYDLSYSGPPSLSVTGNKSDYWWFIFGVPSKYGPGRFSYQAYAGGAQKVTITQADGSSSSSTGPWEWQTEREIGTNQINVADVVTAFDDNYNMAPGSYTSNAGLAETSTWTAFPCSSAPNLQSTNPR